MLQSGMDKNSDKKIKLSKSIQWLEPYLVDAEKMVPEVRLVTSVIARRPTNDHAVQRIHAIIHANLNKTFKIVLMSARKRLVRTEPIEFKIERYSRIELLESLAHEIAHTRHWDHTPDRKILECKLSIVFMKRLAKSGYISEEIEMDKKLGSTDTILT
jgi:hypothetical protein